MTSYYTSGILYSYCHSMYFLQINTSVTPAVDFFFRSRTWREMYESNSSNNSCTVDTTKVDLGLIVFWKVSPCLPANVLKFELHLHCKKKLQLQNALFCGTILCVRK